MAPLLACCVAAVPPAAEAQAPLDAPPSAFATPAYPNRHFDFSAPASLVAPSPGWSPVPRIAGRLTRTDIGLVINTADPYSVEVGEFYAKARSLGPAQILRLELPARATLSAAEFDVLAARVQSYFGPGVQALALAWTVPYAVSCNSITGALALGYDETLCANTCAASRLSPYFDRATSRPFADLKMRPSMLLAAPDATAAKAMIRRGVAADFSLGLRGGAPAEVYFVATPDKVRSVRATLFPPAGLLPGSGVDVHVERTPAIENAERVLLYMTGLVRVDKLDTLKWLPGAAGDHLTSTGGQLIGGGGQMSILDWIASGATASYGTVSEPCAHLQKFPHPQVMLLNYLQGSSLLEAYWKSVAWPQQGVFIGEPLAAPFARR